MVLRVLLLGGGSIGHIAPLIAVWREIQKRDPSAEACVICADRPEELAFCREEGLRAVGVPRLRATLRLTPDLLGGVRVAKNLFAEFRPDVVFCKGGSLSIPACRLARKKRIPVVLHESDAVMGRANRLLSRWATVVCTAFGGGTVTGNPVRPDITKGDAQEGLRLAGFSGAKPVVMVCGGSQGAAALNHAVASQLDALLTRCDVLHLTGPGKDGAEPRPGYFALPFAHKELPHFYAAATLAVSRAGAGTMSELAANGVPMILVPIRGLAQDHQWHNAKAAVRSGMARILEQDALGMLSAEVIALLDDRTAREAMSRAGRQGVGEAARRIAEIVCGCVAR